MTYRNDPRWKAAQADYVADVQPGERAVDALIRRQDAAVRMYRVETEYARAQAGGEGA